jgi:glucosamine 6-phosphate synthetase-like amidotransferase/phosphosugar isomerase protein
MIRSNPGFMLLHDGVIQWKSHLSGIDVPQLSAAPLGQSHYGQVLTVSRLSRVLLITLILLLPSLLHIVASMLPRRLQRVFRVLARRKALQKKGDAFSYPDIPEYLSPLLSVLCFQYLSYYVALEKDLPIDKPRNLAKSVTVE